MESKYASTYRRRSVIILLLCVSFEFYSYHVTANATRHQKPPLKFYMTPRHRQAIRPNDIRGKVIPNKSSIGMLVNISFGNPPVPQLLVMDTGSDLMWIQCASCSSCFEEITPVYDPTKSSTFRDIKCTAGNNCPGRKCSKLNNCIYHTSYADSTRSDGTLATEQLTFYADNGAAATTDGVTFGCGIVNNFVPVDGGESGVLGLSAGPLSLSSQKGRKFSYCIGDLSDHSYAHNQLILGDGAKFYGDSTPLEVYDSLYYLTLQGISFGESKLSIDEKVFQRSVSGKGGVVIDSGTSVTLLPKDVYDLLMDQVVNTVGSLLKKVFQLDALCYSGVVSRDAIGFPTVTLHFADGADLSLEPRSFFEQYDESTMCVAMRANDDADQASVIGIRAQQGYNVGFDPDGKKLYLEYIDCELVED